MGLRFFQEGLVAGKYYNNLKSVAKIFSISLPCLVDPRFLPLFDFRGRGDVERAKDRLTVNVIVQ